MHFNPHSPCGERPLVVGNYVHTYLISIHTPRVGSDEEDEGLNEYDDISIHTPRVGSDLMESKRRRASLDFNPHSPCGERPIRGVRQARGQNISIHTPRVGSDRREMIVFPVARISIHTPRVGSDLVILP